MNSATSNLDSRVWRWQKFLLNRILWILIVFSLPFILFRDITPISHTPVWILYLALFPLALLDRIPHLIRAGLLLLILFSMGVLMIYTFGIEGDGRLYLSLTVILTGVLVGEKPAIILLLVAAAIIALPLDLPPAEFSIQLHALSWEDDRWLWRLGNWVLFTCLVLYSTLFLIKKIQKSYAKLALRADLQRIEKQEAAVRAEFFQQVEENTSDVIWMMDLNASFTYVSPSIEKLYGIKVDDALDMGLGVIRSSEDATRMREILRNEILEDSRRKPGRVFRMETSVLNKSGEEIPVEVVASFLRDDEGKPTGLIGSTRDISDRKQLEVTRTQLIQSQKLESIGQLAGGIAHDFNNLLVVIQGYADLAQDLTENEGDLVEYHEQIQRASSRAAGLTRQLLSFSRRQIMETHPLNLNELINNIGGLLERLLPENIDYTFTPAENINTIDGDVGQLEQAIVNLAVNSRDAMPAGGALNISCSNVELDGKFVDENPWAKTGQYVQILVSDTGSGIPAELLDHVFEPFFTTKAEGEGTGLGLSVFFGIVTQHGGFTHIDSKVGEGTNIYTYLPQIGAKAKKMDVEKTPSRSNGTETILLVEDDEQVRKLASTILTLAGYSIVVAEDGESAVQMFKENASEIALALLDVVLPKLGGHEVMKEILKIRPELPILFTSGYSADGIHTNFILEDDLVLLQKPYSSDSLLQKIRELIEKKQDLSI